MQISDTDLVDRESSLWSEVVDASSVQDHEKLGAALAASLLLAACGTDSETGGVNTVAASTPTQTAAGSAQIPGSTPGAGPTATPTPAATPSPPPASAPTSAPIQKTSPVVAKPSTDEEAVRFLLRAQFAASDEDIAQVKSMGYVRWFDEKTFSAPGISPSAWLESRGYNVAELTNKFFNQPYPAVFAMWYQLFKAPDQLRTRVALALSEFFVVTLNGLAITWTSQLLAKYWELLASSAFGNFRKLLHDVTLHPAMGVFLNTAGNSKEDPVTGKLPDENFGREIMQLFSIGLYELNIDGTERLDASGKKIETYSLSDVTNIARVFTGYEIDYSTGKVIDFGGGSSIPDLSYLRVPMKMNTTTHSFLECKFLGATIPAGTDPAKALNITLDTIFNHPNVGPFFSKQMIQRLVTSNPSPAYVRRVATIFNDNGAGVRGDLNAVFLSILTDDEALSPAGLSSTTWGKLREPMVLLAQWGRSFGIKSLYNSWKVLALRVDNNYVQQPLNAPSVFNYFRPGFVPPSSALVATKSTAPEFQIVSEVSVANHINFMQDFFRNGFPTVNAHKPETVNGGPGVQYLVTYDVSPTYAAELLIANDAAKLVARLNLILSAGQISQATQTIIVDALNATPLAANSTEAQRLDRIATAVLLVMASSEYLIQK